jgi:plasmid maintenance system antidote protein VapI
MADERTGSEVLGELVAPPRLRIADVARTLNVSRTTVENWIAGKHVPSDAHREAMWRHYGIAQDSWKKEEDR